MLLLTIGLLLVIFLISYIVFNREILAPPTVVSLGLFFSTLCAYYNEETWALRFSDTTTIMIIVGVFSFMVGGIIAILFANRKHLNRVGFSHKIFATNPLMIARSKTLLVIVFQLMTAFLLYKEMRDLTGYSAWIDVVITFRHQTATVNPLDYTMHLSKLLKLCIEFSFACALVYSYIVGNDIAVHKKQNFLNWMPIILSCLHAFMQGYRSDMLRMWIAILIVAYTLKKRSVGWKNNKDTKKLVRKVAFSALIIGVFFVLLRGIVGRNTDTDALYYFTFFAGSPVAALDLFLKDPLSSSDIWGKETFYHLNQNIGVWSNDTGLRYIFYKEFRMSPNGTFIGNVYTALRPPYYDFGFIGMIIYMIIMGWFFTYFYYKTRDQFGNHPVDFRLLLYSYVAYTFFMYFYNCYNNFVSISFIKLFLELLLVRSFLFDFHLRY